MKCPICHNSIPPHDHYFTLNPSLIICESCATVTTIADLYMSNLIEMANSEDAAIESTAVISDADPIDVVYDELNSVPEKQIMSSPYGTVAADPINTRV